MNYRIVTQFLRFVLVGAMNTGIDFLVLNIEMLITGITSGPLMLVQNALSFGIATINSYYFNKKWTFEDKSDESQAKKFSSFLSVSIIGIILNSTIVYAVTTFVSPVLGINEVLWANIAKVFATGISLIWNFIGYKFLVFKK